MRLQEPLHCTQLFLDLICYEALGERLSPEMELILENHLSECPSCKKEVRNFMELLKEEKVL